MIVARQLTVPNEVDGEPHLGVITVAANDDSGVVAVELRRELAPEASRAVAAGPDDVVELDLDAREWLRNALNWAGDVAEGNTHPEDS